MRKKVPRIAQAEFLAKKSRQAAMALRRGSGRNAVNNPSSGRNEQT
jgi:hypothetical protein